jgi:hypothetical protein
MTQAPPPPIPAPTPQPEWDYYWEKTKQNELWLMRCKDCNQAYFYPRPICPNCFSRNTEWFQSSGKGTLYAFAIIHRAPMPAFREKTPYVAAYIELEDGVRVPTNLIDVEPDPEHVRIGMACEVVYEAISDTITLPMFKPV